MNYQITVRHGKKVQRYLMLSLEASDAVAAIRAAANSIPEEIVPEVDLVELRAAPDPHVRGGGGAPGSVDPVSPRG